MSAVLTWIVHATALVAIVSIAARAARRLAPVTLNPATRYCLWWAVMAAVLALPGIHAIWPAPAEQAGVASTIAASPSPTQEGAVDAAPIAVIVPGVIAVAMPWLVAMGVVLVIGRLLALVRATAFLRRVRARCHPLPHEIETALPGWLSARGTGRQARLLVSPDLAGPAVLGPVLGSGLGSGFASGFASGLGERDPIIALPAWTIERLDPQSLDLIVLHEHAHVERGDDRDLLVQSTIEALFCWHPAVTWIGRRLDEERERACDDAVVLRTGRAAPYARCLVDVAARGVASPGLRLASAVGRARGRLTTRIERLLATSSSVRVDVRPSSVSVGSLALAVIATISVVAWPRLHVADPKWDRMPTSSMPLSTRAQPVSSSLDVWPALVGAAVVPAPVRTLVVSPPARRPRLPKAVSWATPPDSAPQPNPVLESVERGQANDAAVRVAAIEPAPVASLEAPTHAAGALPIFSLSPLEAAQSLARSVDAVELGAETRPLDSTPHSHRFLATAGTGSAAVSPNPDGTSPWKRTADAGESIGRGAAHAGVKTAGFFSRMGRAIASSF
jgi:beta-lactamase regulating signal transducer with metallopeptidase domain